jgi:TRAP-type C4-dicarboxylate transport system permease small subunit
MGIESGLRRVGIELVIILLFIYMTIAVIVQVIGRYVFNFSIASAVETGDLRTDLMVICRRTAMRWGLHVSVDILITQLPRKVVRSSLFPSRWRVCGSFDRF